jgi:predicted RND superfamily exporter protein
MSMEDISEQDKRALYWLGNKLIDHRHPIMILVLAVTGLFAYWTFQLKLETSFSDLLPQSHPFVQVHKRLAGTLGGAKNSLLLVVFNLGHLFTVPTLAGI